MKRLLLTIMTFLLPMSMAHAETFIGVDYGLTTYTEDGFATTGEFDNEDTGYVLAAGNRFTNGVGIEFNYADLGSVSLDLKAGDLFTNDGVVYQALEDFTLSGKTTSYGIAVSQKWEIDRLNSFTPRIGFHQWDADFEATSASIGIESINDDGIDLFYGLDYEHNLSNNVAVVAGATFYSVDDESLDLLKIGIRYSFN